MDKAGIERKVARAYGFHLFRHSAGSQMHEVTGDLKQTQGFLGHGGIGVTSDVYVHLQPDSEIGVTGQEKRSAAISKKCVMPSSVTPTSVRGTTRL